MTTCAGCAEEAYALERGVKPEQIKVFTDPPSGIKMLQQGRVDVFALSGLGTQDLLKKTNDPNLELVMPVMGVPVGCSGAAFNADDKEFRDAFDKALQELKDSGEFAAIIEPYGFAAQATLAVKRDTYTSEVFRAGIENVPRGQWDAARALNYSPVQTWKDVILPQAIPPMIPPLANYLITMFKETPLLAAITVVELFNAANIYSNSHYKYLEPMTLVGLFFLLVSVPSAIAAIKLERRFSTSRT